MCLLDKAQWDALLGLSLSTEGLFLSEEASIPEYKALGNLSGKMSGGMPAISSGKGEGARAASSSDRKVVLKGLMVKSLLISSAEYHQHGGSQVNRTPLTCWWEVFLSVSWAVSRNPPSPPSFVFQLSVWDA